MRQIISQQDAQTLFKPYFELLNNSVLEGFQKYVDAKASILGVSQYMKLNKRTKASLIHDMVSSTLHEKFQSIENVVVRHGENTNSFFTIKFADLAIARIKKLDSELKPANIQTQKTIRFNNQYTLDGFPDQPTFLYVGYTLNPTLSEIEGVYIVCRVADGLRWYIDITNELVFEQLNLVDQNVQLVNEEPRVKVKKSLQEKQRRTGTE